MVTSVDDGLLRISTGCVDPSPSAAWYVELLNFTVATKTQGITPSINSKKTNILVLSVIVTTALFILPGTTTALNDDGIIKLRLNDSGPSTILSLVTGILIVVLVVPAVKVVVIGVEV